MNFLKESEDSALKLIVAKKLVVIQNISSIPILVIFFFVFFPISIIRSNVTLDHIKRRSNMDLN